MGLNRCAINNLVQRLKTAGRRFKMDNGNGEMSDETRRKFEIQKRAYKELAALKKELEKLKKKIQQTDKNPLPPSQNSPAEEITNLQRDLYF